MLHYKDNEMVCLDVVAENPHLTAQQIAASGRHFSNGNKIPGLKIVDENLHITFEQIEAVEYLKAFHIGIQLSYLELTASWPSYMIPEKTAACSLAQIPFDNMPMPCLEFATRNSLFTTSQIGACIEHNPFYANLCFKVVLENPQATTQQIKKIVGISIPSKTRIAA